MAQAKVSKLTEAEVIFPALEHSPYPVHVLDNR